MCKTDEKMCEKLGCFYNVTKFISNFEEKIFKAFSGSSFTLGLF